MENNSDKDHTWIIDPIDGTINFPWDPHLLFQLH